MPFLTSLSFVLDSCCHYNNIDRKHLIRTFNSLASTLCTLRERIDIRDGNTGVTASLTMIYRKINIDFMNGLKNILTLFKLFTP